MNRNYDKHVTWEKLQGKPDASMQETKGEGFLGMLPEAGDSLFISGDRGVSTSLVQSLEVFADHIMVKTKNSLYKVTPRK